MFEVNTKALRGAPGIWVHVSVRYDKVDIYPHPKLIENAKIIVIIFDLNYHDFCNSKVDRIYSNTAK